MSLEKFKRKYPQWGRAVDTFEKSVPAQSAKVNGKFLHWLKDNYVLSLKPKKGGDTKKW